MVVWVYVLVKGSFTGVFDEKTEVKYLVHHSITCQNLEFKSLLPPGQVVSGLLKPKFSQYQMEIVLFHLQDLDKDRR